MKFPNFMNNTNINLYEILKGHEGEIFYSPIYGNLTYHSILYPLVRFKTVTGTIFDINANGKVYEDSDELFVFPSKNQRNWNKWDKENNHKTPKTWSEFVEKDNAMTYNLEVTYNEYQPHSTSYTPIEKSALALLKIHQLIDNCYGGIVKEISYHTAGIASNLDIVIEEEFNEDFKLLYPLIFKDTQLAKEFLSYDENKQLIKDYYIL